MTLQLLGKQEKLPTPNHNATKKQRQDMKIVFVGAGNLATNVARALKNAGHEITQVYSRTQESADSLASQVGADAVSDLDDVARESDIYIVSVKDGALSDVVARLCDGSRRGLFVHTAGSIPMSIFEGHADRYGVFYPMQSFSKQRQVDFTDVSVFVEARHESDLRLLTDLGSSLSQHVMQLDSEGRKHLHLAAVFACNFVNHCYDLASEVLDRYDIPFSSMLPLIDETARKVHSMSPKSAQTGPAIRYDENVIGMQSRMLDYDDRIRQIYDLMSKSIHQRSGK